MISWYNRTWADRAYNPRGDTRTAELRYAAWSADPDQTALAWYDRVSAGDWNVVQNTCQHAIVHDPIAPELGGGDGGGGGGGGDRRTTWDVDGDGFGDFATENEARAYMFQIYLDDRDPDATGPDYNAIERALHNCNHCDGPDRSSWVDPESDDHGGGGTGLADFFTSVGEFFSSIFGGGNNNDNDDNDDQDDDQDDDEEDDSGGGFWDRLWGRAT